jgi:hypothetical protein
MLESKPIGVRRDEEAREAQSRDKLMSDVMNSSERKQEVVLLREQERATIYITKMSKQVTRGHVRDAVHMYLVN